MPGITGGIPGIRGGTPGINGGMPGGIPGAPGTGGNPGCAIGGYNLVEAEQAVAEMKLKLQSHHHHIRQSHLVASFFDSLVFSVQEVVFFHPCLFLEYLPYHIFPILCQFSQELHLVQHLLSLYAPACNE